MATETITREEFDKRLEAVNEQRAQELQAKEEQQAAVEQLLARYERSLDEIEARLEDTEEPVSHRAVLRKRLSELAQKTAALATSL